MFKFLSVVALTAVLSYTLAMAGCAAESTVDVVEQSLTSSDMGSQPAKPSGSPRDPGSGGE
jgi:hypothetical protein